MGGTAVETVLVPIDGSEESMAAIELAVAIADRYGAGLHATYVLGENATRSLEDGTPSDDELAAETAAVFETVREMADRAGVALTHSSTFGFSTRRLLVHPGSVVLDAADQIDADFLVVPRTERVDEPSVLEKAAEYVLLYASQPVLSV